MNKESVIQVSNLYKEYHIYNSPLDRLKDSLFFGLNVNKKNFLALQNINIDIFKSQTVGIVGLNGSGKSTLLKIIAGVVNPSKGKVKINGIVSAILELGAGFNKEATGLENIYLNGLAYGLTKKDIDNMIEEIVSFSELGDFINRPVKTYSSGMYARLAFSVAIHVKSDILIVDEALSVGDAKFQQKCFKKIRQLQENGMTILFVSHSLDSVVQLCDEAILLDKGVLISKGPTKEIVKLYNHMLFGESNKKNISKSIELTFEDIDEDINLSKEIEYAMENLKGGNIFTNITSSILNINMQPIDTCISGEKIFIQINIFSNFNIGGISVAVEIYDKKGLLLTGESIFNKFNKSISFKKEENKKILFSFNADFCEGDYFMQLRINRVTTIDRRDNILLYINEQSNKFTILQNKQDPIWFKVKKDFDILLSK